ncbi:hypothetical protein EV360DRAFT_77002 [Lentinula raphanica]|nr:hypothetical protein EV360DRAFT_77002 [Lentinula raphanica]
MSAPIKIDLDPTKYRRSTKSASRIREGKGILTLRFEGNEETLIKRDDMYENFKFSSTRAVSLISQFSVSIKNDSTTDNRELLSYGTVRGILKTKKRGIKVLVTYFLRSTEIKKCLRENGYPPEFIDGLSNNEFIDTDIEGIVDGRDVLDLAGLHLLTDDIKNVDCHLLTAKALFYRFFFSTATGHLDVLGNGHWFNDICNVCQEIYNPDMCCQVYCQECRHWFCLLHVDPLVPKKNKKKAVKQVSVDKTPHAAQAQTAPLPVPSSAPPPHPLSTPPPLPLSTPPLPVARSSTHERTSSTIAGPPPPPAPSAVGKAGKDKDPKLAQKGQDEGMDIDDEGPKQDKDEDMHDHTDKDEDEDMENHTDKDDDDYKDDDGNDGESEKEEQNDDGDDGDGETDAESEGTKGLGKITVTYLPPVRQASHATNHGKTEMKANASPAKILENLREAPIIRGLGWVDELYPHGHAAGVHGWLVTGNHFLHSTQWEQTEGFPGKDWAETWAYAYEQGSKATPDAVAKSMMAVLPAIEQDWRCPTCQETI